MRTASAIAQTLSDYIAECEQLRAENEELRATIAELLQAALMRHWRREQLREALELAREEIPRRWP